jgi:D-arabinose 1-dehydrogenase-like Zn-dependent alcohol dehydrogenase
MGNRNMRRSVNNFGYYTPRINEKFTLIYHIYAMDSPLIYWKAGPGKKVRIIGLGGLGHMGVKIADALGSEVSVLSHSLKKQEDGLKMGADKFYATSDHETFKNLVFRLNYQHSCNRN